MLCLGGIAFSALFDKLMDNRVIFDNPYDSKHESSAADYSWLFFSFYCQQWNYLGKSCIPIKAKHEFNRKKFSVEVCIITVFITKKTAQCDFIFHDTSYHKSTPKTQYKMLIIKDYTFIYLKGALPIESQNKPSLCPRDSRVKAMSLTIIFTSVLSSQYLQLQQHTQSVPQALSCQKYHIYLHKACFLFL